MSEAKRRKVLGYNHVPIRDRTAVTLPMIKEWLYSLDVKKWLISCDSVNWNYLLSGFAEEIIKDIGHDHLSTTESREYTIGVNVLNWTLWCGVIKPDKSEIWDYPLNVWGDRIAAEKMIIYPVDVLDNDRN